MAGGYFYVDLYDNIQSSGGTLIQSIKIGEYSGYTLQDALNDYWSNRPSNINGWFVVDGDGAIKEISLSTDISDPGDSYSYIYPSYEVAATPIIGFMYNGTEYKFEGGGGTADGISTTQPSNPVTGSTYYDTTNKVVKVYNGTSWEEVGGDSYTAGTGINITNDEILLDGTYEGTIQDYSAMQGPAPDGFHVPLATEWQGLNTIMSGLGLTTGNYWKAKLHMPLAGYRYYTDASITTRAGVCSYWSSSPYDSPNQAYYFRMYSNSVTVGAYARCANGYSVRCFKDEFVTPTSSWTVIKGTLGSAGIFWNQTDGLISITNGTTGYTIQDKNLGATTVYNDGDTFSESNCGKYYQWGNNYGFPFSGNVTTSSTQVDASSYGPGNYYSSDTFITGNDNWSNVQNDNLWGGVTGIQTFSASGNLVLGDKIYKIVTSTTAPASGTASNIITIVTD